MGGAPHLPVGRRGQQPSGIFYITDRGLFNNVANRFPDFFTSLKNPRIKKKVFIVQFYNCLPLRFFLEIGNIFVPRAQVLSSLGLR